MIYSREELERLENEGQHFNYLLFYGHQKEGDLITKSCLSNWWEQPFVVDGITYPHNEQFIMAEKARLFGDDQKLKQILATANQGACKRFGRQVVGFDSEVWDKNVFDIAVRGSYAKFSQNEDLKAFLLSTGDSIIIEAAPRDRKWGIGLSEHDQRAHYAQLWRGDNLQGFSLMKVRDLIRENEGK